MLTKIIITRALADTQSDLAVREVNISDLGGLVAKVTSIAGAVAGVAAFFYLLYSGFLYLTAGGNSDQTKKAAQGIVSAIIGLFVIVLAYAVITAIKDVVK